MNEDNYITFGQDETWPFGFVKAEEKKCCRCGGMARTQVENGHGVEVCWMCNGTGKDLT